jgi:hypothetical protein
MCQNSRYLFTISLFLALFTQGQDAPAAPPADRSQCRVQESLPAAAARATRERFAFHLPGGVSNDINSYRRSSGYYQLYIFLHNFDVRVNQVHLNIAKSSVERSRSVLRAQRGFSFHPGAGQSDAGADRVLQSKAVVERS